MLEERGLIEQSEEVDEEKKYSAVLGSGKYEDDNPKKIVFSPGPIKFFKRDKNEMKVEEKTGGEPVDITDEDEKKVKISENNRVAEVNEGIKRENEKIQIKNKIEKIEPTQKLEIANGKPEKLDQSKIIVNPDKIQVSEEKTVFEKTPALSTNLNPLTNNKISLNEKVMEKNEKIQKEEPPNLINETQSSNTQQEKPRKKLDAKSLKFTNQTAFKPTTMIENPFLKIETKNEVDNVPNDEG
jgi:hypothetical protein